MFNFDCSIKFKNDLYEIKNNSVFRNGTKVFRNGTEDTSGINAHSGNAIIKVYEAKVLQHNSTHLNSLNLTDLIKEIKYLKGARETLIFLKAKCCDGPRSKTLEKYQDILSFRINGIFNKIDTKRFSYPECLILKHLTERSFEGEIDFWCLEEQFDTVKDDYSKYQNIYNEVMTYSYKSLGFSLEEVTKDFLELYKQFLEGVKSFRYIKNSLGNRLVNFSNGGVTRRLRTAKMCEDRIIYNWINTYRKHLKAQGVEVKGGEDIFTKNPEELSQEELFKIYKQGKVDQSFNTIERMDVTTLYKVMTSNLKVITKKFKTSYGHTTFYSDKVIKRAIELFKTEQDYNTLITFITTHNLWKSDSITWKYFISNIKYVKPEEVIKLGQIRRDAPEYLPFKSVYDAIPKSQRLDINEEFSEVYFWNMSEPELLEVLKSVAKERNEDED